MKDMFQKIKRVIISAVMTAALAITQLTAVAYGAEATGTLSIPVTVSVSNTAAPADTVYRFVLTGENNAPMPETSEITITGAGTASFGPITYTTATDYRYRISQASEAVTNFTYDTSVYVVTVQVVNSEDGTLKANIVASKENSSDKSDSIGFENGYTTPGGGGTNNGGGGSGGSSGNSNGGSSGTISGRSSGDPTTTITDPEVPLDQGTPLEQLQEIVENLVPLAALPKTGDTFHWAIWLSVNLLSLTAIVGLGIGLIKRRKTEQ